LFQVAKWILGTIPSAILLVTALLPYSGPLWPAFPVVEVPEDKGDESSLSSPFTIKNPGMLFAISKARLTCGIQEVIATTGSGWFGFVDIAYKFGNTDVPNNPPLPYGCDPLRLIRINPDGSLGMRQQLATGPSDLHGPIKIQKVCIWIGVDWKIEVAPGNWTGS
jgi:hypothetical protein